MNPVWFVLLLLVGMPLFELYLLIKVGSVIGALPTIALSVFTAVLGSLLMRAQGLSTLLRVQAAMARGEIPAAEVVEGAIILVAGFVLLLPGFFTDALGLLALVTPLRRQLVQLFIARRRDGRVGSQPGSSAGHFIEGEYRRLDDE